MKTRQLLRFTLSLPLVAIVGAGCAADARGGGEEDVDSEIAALEDGHTSMVGAPPPMGPLALFFAALNEPSISAEKRAEIQGVLDAARSPATEEDRHRRRAAALAEAVRSGVVEPAKLEPSAAEVLAHEKNIHARITSALTALHGVLDADEREAVVARVREHKPGAGPRPPHGPHGQPHGDHLGILLHGVSLDDAQRTKIEAALEEAGLDGPPPAPPAPPDPAVLDAFLDSFATDAFDASALPTPPRMPRPPVLEALAVVVPLLEAEQREALAEKILRGPPRPPAPR